MAVVRDVRVGHEHVVITDLGDAAAARGAAVNRDELAEHIAVTDDQPGGLAVKFQILRNQSNRGERKDLVAVTDVGGPLDDRGGADAAVATESDMLTDDGM